MRSWEVAVSRDAVNGLDGSIDRGIVADGFVRAVEIVINGAGLRR